MSRADRIVAATLFVAAFALGTWYVPQVVAAGGRPHFYQEEFGPAVMVACGHGYVNPQPTPELNAFLAVQSDAISCSPELATLARAALTPMQRAYRYLITTVGWTWRLQGRVAWSAIAPLYGLFFASTIALLFAVFRQGMGIWVSASGAVILALSPLHVSYLAQLRDYSKTPFVLALVLCAARLVRGPLTFRRAATLAAGAGVLNGVAMGFRNDLLVAVPAFVGLLIVFLNHDLFRRGWRDLMLAGIYVAGFAIALSPMWSIYQTGGGNSSQHLIVLGLGEQFSEEMGADAGGMYDVSYGYRDEFAHAIISSNATQRLGATTMLRQYGPEYDRSASDYLEQVVWNFPADMLTRAYASALRVVELPYNRKLLLPPVYIQIYRPAQILRDRLQRALAPVWLLIVIATLFVLTVRSTRIGLVVLLLVSYLSAYPALQFSERHYFHLEFIAWWALGFVLSAAAGLGRAGMKGTARAWLEAVRPPQGWARAVLYASILWLGIGILLLTPLYVLRRFQQEHLRLLFEQVLAAPLDASALRAVPQGNGYVRFDAPMSREAMQAVVSNDAVHPELFLAEFGGPTCNSLKLDVVFRYSSVRAPHDFSRPLVVQPPLSSTPIQVVFPAYYHRPRVEDRDLAVPMDYGFVGLDVPESAQACLIRFARVRDTTGLPLLFELRLPPRWQSADLFQTIEGIETRVNPDQWPQEYYTFPPDLEVGRRLLMLPIEHLEASAIFRRSPTLDTANPHQWLNNGVGGVGGKGPFLYLFEMQPRQLEEGRLALVQGFIKKGGISFGLVSSGQWIAQVGVTRPGEFTVVVRVPTTATYSLVLANNLHGSSLENDLVIRRVGWLPKDPQ